MQKISQLILPPRALASCIAGCIVRDTRAVQLPDADRMNYFPASPLFTATLTSVGQINVADRIVSLDDLRKTAAAPRLLFQPPHSQPHMSWSPGPILAKTIAFFPDAWQQLGGSLDGTPPSAIISVISRLDAKPLRTAWPVFWKEMEAIWANRDHHDRRLDWVGSARLKDWTYHVSTQLAQTGPGRSLRSAQRRLRRWTGQSRQTLAFFAQVEEVHRLVNADPTTKPAELAAEAGFSDQSHMGRALKRATGFAPVQLNEKIATEEAFWCYRLLGERF